jgi:hypothetical protein
MEENRMLPIIGVVVGLGALVGLSGCSKITAPNDMDVTVFPNPFDPTTQTLKLHCKDTSMIKFEIWASNGLFIAGRSISAAEWQTDPLGGYQYTVPSDIYPSLKQGVYKVSAVFSGNKIIPIKLVVKRP